MSWVWLGWILALIVTFAILEGYALHTDRTTLSRFTWRISKAFPAFPFFIGLIVGFLACHFFWGGVVAFAPP